MAKTKAQRYVGGLTPFGTIISVEDRVYNAEATVEAKDGTTRVYRLPFLIAHGVMLASSETEPPKPLKALASEQPST